VSGEQAGKLWEDMRSEYKVTQPPKTGPLRMLVSPEDSRKANRRRKLMRTPDTKINAVFAVVWHRTIS